MIKLLLTCLILTLKKNIIKKIIFHKFQVQDQIKKILKFLD